MVLVLTSVVKSLIRGTERKGCRGGGAVYSTQTDEKLKA